jgi:hypothetical protein
VSAWYDIACLDNRRDAAHAIDVEIANITRPAEAVELVGAHYVREISPDGAWNEPIVEALLPTWRERLFARAMLRWQASARRRLLADELHDAAERIERRADKCGIQLPRTALDTLKDAIREEREL